MEGLHSISFFNQASLNFNVSENSIIFPHYKKGSHHCPLKKKKWGVVCNRELLIGVIIMNYLYNHEEDILSVILITPLSFLTRKYHRKDHTIRKSGFVCRNYCGKKTNLNRLPSRTKRKEAPTQTS